MSQIKLKPDSGLGAAAPATDAQLLALRTGFGLGNVDNTSDANKPISTAVQAALDAVSPVDNLTTNDATKPLSAAQGVALKAAVDAAGGAALPIAAALVIPLDTAGNGKLMASQTLTAASAITFSIPATPVEQANCTFCLIGDGNSAHVPDFSVWKLGNSYAYDYTAGVKNIYSALYTFDVPFLYGTGNGAGAVATVPGAPTIGTATAGDGAASVTFTPPASNGGSAITGYTVTSTPGGLTGTGSATPIAVSGLANGTAYTFKAKATNSVGTGAESAASNSVTPASEAFTDVTILDLDFQKDVGDLGAADVALMAHKLGLHKIVGVALGTSDPKVPAAFDAIRKWYGVSQLPIGVWKGVSKDAASSGWPDLLANEHDHDVGLASTVPDSTVTLRTLLAAAADGSVNYIAGGYANCMDALLSSPADGISTMTGAQLIAAKVKMLWWSAGEFPTSSTSEFNMQGGGTPDPVFCAMSDRVVNNWPSPITYAGFAYGENPKVETTKLVATKSIADPRRRCFAGFVNGGAGGDNGGWDEQIIVLGLDQAGHTFVKGSCTGVSASGINTWVANASGKDRYAVKTQPAQWYKDRIEGLSCADPGTTTPTIDWGTATPITPKLAPIPTPLDTANAGEKLPNSTFNTGIAGWAGVNATLQWANGRLVVLHTGSYPIAHTQFAAVPGQVYTCTAHLSLFEGAPATAGNEVSIYIKDGPSYSDASNTSQAGTSKRTSTGDFTFTFTATATTSTVMLIREGSSQSSFAFDTVSVV